MRAILFLSVIAIITFSCKQSSSGSFAADSTAISDSALKEPLYPYTDYISKQIAYVDSTPLAIELTVRENGQLKDSAFISRDQFHTIAKEFTEPDLNATALRPFYTETSFQDLSLNSITFTITARNHDLPVQEANILLDPETQEVKNVIIKKEEGAGDSTVTKTLLWVNKMNCQIISSVSKKDGTNYNRVTKLVWDKKRSNTDF